VVSGPEFASAKKSRLSSGNCSGVFNGPEPLRLVLAIGGRGTRPRARR
jgi:hypothetical protein